jgi:hypothetical protein
MKPLFALLICLLFFAACSQDNSVDSDNNRTGMLQLFLTDKPIDLKEVWVTITDIQVHKTGENWINFDASGDSVDLLTLVNREQLLQSKPLEAGTYTGIRLQVSDGHIVDADGNRCDLKIPSGKVEIPLNFKIEAGNNEEVVLDFNAEKSVHVTQTGHNGQCILRPVIHVKSAS